MTCGPYIKQQSQSQTVTVEHCMCIGLSTAAHTSIMTSVAAAKCDHANMAYPLDLNLHWAVLFFLAPLAYSAVKYR